MLPAASGGPLWGTGSGTRWVNEAHGPILHPWCNGGSRNDRWYLAKLDRKRLIASFWRVHTVLGKICSLLYNGIYYWAVFCTVWQLTAYELSSISGLPKAEVLTKLKRSQISAKMSKFKFALRIGMPSLMFGRNFKYLYRFFWVLCSRSLCQGIWESKPEPGSWQSAEDKDATESTSLCLSIEKSVPDGAYSQENALKPEMTWNQEMEA